ncbi:acetoacetate decarboxylase family protein [Streptomyces sp. DSM 44917]|uniref:Acetoacetate decarboxylase family protein n=1 Tax=Streptomyces boetiae TaxID=3075541 RepID=A0ABU2LER2_9ACTN|nr:acetoacetate decarboxylase family protein [Streptomyces sp. DSM 44917]MDT0310069.1 acetoacetate decarboxylase family protein [Streptomyces sp. DSM 44917]
MTDGDASATEDPAERPAPYPPSPWHLAGDMYVSAWLVPVADLPRWRLAPGVRPWVLGGRCTLLTFWVDYSEGSVLEYRELLVALTVRHGRGLAAAAVAVWVDDERSLAGGRALWGIPKELGTFRFAHGGLEASEAGSFEGTLTPGGGRPVNVRYRDRFSLPGALPLRWRLVQRREGEPCVAPYRLSGRATVGHATLTAPTTGPLSFLHGRKPLASLALRDFTFRFGA